MDVQQLDGLSFFRKSEYIEKQKIHKYLGKRKIPNAFYCLFLNIIFIQISKFVHNCDV